MWLEPKSGQTRNNTEQKLLKKCRKKLEVVKYVEKHSNAAAAKHYDTDEALKGFHIAVYVNWY